MRADLRLDDLKGREHVASKLMNVKIPAEVSDKIQKVATSLKASKTEVVIALLNEGLNVSLRMLKGYKPAKVVSQKSSKKICSVAGCNRPYVAKGFCANHYQAWRRGKLQA